VILFNTCSVREKAQDKVFSDLGRVKHLKHLKPDLVIGSAAASRARKAPRSSSALRMSTSSSTADAAPAP